MTALPDETLKKPQHEVQRLLGRCLLQIQQYERMLKAVVVASHEISGTPQQLEANLAARKADAARKTLGNLVGTLLDSVVVKSGNSIFDEKDTDPPERGSWISMRFYKEFADEDFVQIERDLKEFVQLRNNLVHHFIEQQDLRSLDGCRDAKEVLIAADKRIGLHLAELRAWAESMNDTRQRAAELLGSDEFQEFFVNGIAPDGNVHWPKAGIVYALRAAAAELAVDGWTSVAEASNWIADREPEQIPEKYGCRSWRQVVHNSRIFDLRYFEEDGQRHCRYREKTSTRKSH